MVLGGNVLGCCGGGGYTEGARVYHNANQNLANAAWTILSFNSERYDTDGIHDNAINNNRLTCRTGGKYAISGEAHVFPHATGYRFIQIELNGLTAICYRMSRTLGAAWPTSLFAYTQVELSAGDYVRLGVFQNSGGVLVAIFGNYVTPEFMMQRIG